MNTWKGIKSWAVFLFVVLAPFKTDAVQSHQTEDLEQFLQEFHQNPVQVMEQLPWKKAQFSRGAAVEVIPVEAQQNNAFIDQKDELRSKICRLENGQAVCATDIQGRAGFDQNDLAENLVDNGYRHIKQLSTMDRKGLQSAVLNERPWSDDYWSIAKGILGARYADPGKDYDSDDWKENYDYISLRPASTYIENEAIAYLSPSEKYDLLVGDENQTLTKKMWSEGRQYYNRNGEVETWMGICHGWAPAAYMMKRPTSKVDVIAADGKTMISFFPSDIKSLASLLWANVKTNTKFIGGRCNKKDPRRDSENGRIIDRECFDTNPGTWHKTVVNQIGVAKRSFIIDATYDYEVWNQPVYSYSYRYFNPQTFETSDFADDVVIKPSDYKKDKFKPYRDPRTARIVGVEMRLEYIAETDPDHRAFDNEDYDYVTSVRYRYDLEINRRGSIIGGEWYSNKHPDFLWTPPRKERALTRLDNSIIEAIKQGRTDLVWKKRLPIPAVWRKLIPNYISKEGQPLGLIVEGLIERSRAQY